MTRRLSGVLAVTALFLTAATLALLPAGPADATGSRAWSQDFGITPDVFTTPASPSLPVGAAVPVDLVVFDNDPSCTPPSYASCVQPTGTVTISAENTAHTATALGTKPLSSVPSQPGRSGQATFSLPATLAPGSYVILASYSGDSTFSGGSVPAALSLTITQARPTVTLTQSSRSTHPGTRFTVNAAVSYSSTAAPGSPLQPEVPTGSITLNESGGSAPATLPLGSDGSVTFRIAGPTTPGDIDFSATYSGDTDLLATTSTSLLHDVVLVAPPTSPSSSSAATPSAKPPPSQPAITTTTTSNASGVLAATGVPTGALLTAAVTLLMAGAGALALSRRTRPTH
jgi:hypothetical protein